MPPKLLTTFLTGLKLNASFGAGQSDDSSKLLFDFGPSPNVLGDSDNASLQTTAVSANSPGLSTPLPRSAAIATPITPQMVIGGGSTLRTRQLWEGTVTEVRENEFVATLADITNPENPDEQVEFTYDEVSQDDRKLVSSGSGFYCVDRSEQTPGGKEKNVSMVQFRRLPTWTRSSLVQGANRGRNISEVFRSAE
jgi:hypothetical protein